ncbi:MAG: hypothetical protein QGH72_03140 [Dehalococcoidia bacterium]|nr:hypothetical protein [Dehalococcoidia bacterium]
MAEWVETTGASIYVRRDRRHRRTGKQLLRALFAAGKEAGFHIVIGRIVEGSDAGLRSV